MKNHILVYVIAYFHHCVALGLLTAPILCLIYQPWYIALLAIVFVIRTMTSRDTCILTEMERKYRKRINKPLNRSYVYHYFIAPFRTNCKETVKKLDKL